MKLRTVCPKCLSTKEFTLPADEVRRWEGGELIQKVWPWMHVDDRERLISGTCPECWEKMFGGDES